MALAARTRLYEILPSIGAGWIGEANRTKDTQLKREPVLAWV